MNFDYDPNKSQANKEKHGVNFEDAKAIWQDANAITGEAKIVEGEPRWFRIGKLITVIFTVIYTERSEVIRIISARPASREERAKYEG